MPKQTIAKEEAERQISEELRGKHPAAGDVSLSRVADDRWRCDLDGHDVDGTMASDADRMLQWLLQECDISEMPRRAVSVEELNTTNDE